MRLRVDTRPFDAEQDRRDEMAELSWLAVSFLAGPEMAGADDARRTVRPRSQRQIRAEKRTLPATTARTAIVRDLGKTMPPATAVRLVALVAGAYGLSPLDLYRPGRDRSWPSAVATYLLRERFGLTYHALGRTFSQHWTTAMDADKRVRRAMLSSTRRAELRAVAQSIGLQPRDVESRRAA